mgnify:FL=1
MEVYQNINVKNSSFYINSLFLKVYNELSTHIIKQGIIMNYTVTTTKSVNEAVESIENNVKEYKFGILHIHDVKSTLNEKGVVFSNECKILDVCNPHQAKELLSVDMIMSMTMPCKISVYTDQKETKISMLKPTEMFPNFNKSLNIEAQEIKKV